MSWLAVLALLVVVIVSLVIKRIVAAQGEAMLLSVPGLLLRWAWRRAGADHRDELYAEWTGELDHILRRHDGFPISQLCAGIPYAAGLVYAAPIITRERRRATALLAQAGLAIAGSAGSGPGNPDSPTTEHADDPQ
jgi:hypothetical protein